MLGLPLPQFRDKYRLPVPPPGEPQQHQEDAEVACGLIVVLAIIGLAALVQIALAIGWLLGG